MKDQYFGDIHDYHKYGLLRALQASGGLSLLVAWLLTPDDGGPDGSRRAYLHEPGRWRHFDPPLFDFLAEAVAGRAAPAVATIERSAMLPGARFFSEMVPTQRSARSRWGDRLLECSAGTDLVFLDPDNGFEIRSSPIGTKNSSKYVAWSEVERLWAAGSSLLVYQHKTMEKTDLTIERLREEVGRRTGSAFVRVFNAPDVLYFLIAQPRHSRYFREAIANELSRWRGRIEVVAQPRPGKGDSMKSGLMTRERLLASAGEAAPVIEALLALEGERGIRLIPTPKSLSLWVDADGELVPMLYIYAAGVHFSPDCPCLMVDGRELRERRGPALLDAVHDRLSGDGSWRLMTVDAQYALDRAFSESEIAKVVGFTRWLRDQISTRALEDL